jgi:hypothetical protein
MTVLDFVTTARPNRFGVALIQLHDSLWRVTAPSGDVLGYVEKLESAERFDSQFRAKRYITSRRTFVDIGEFWSFDDAVDCYRPN